MGISSPVVVAANGLVDLAKNLGAKRSLEEDIKNAVNHLRVLTNTFLEHTHDSQVTKKVKKCFDDAISNANEACDIIAKGLTY